MIQIEVMNITIYNNPTYVNTSWEWFAFMDKSFIDIFYIKYH